MLTIIIRNYQANQFAFARPRDAALLPLPSGAGRRWARYRIRSAAAIKSADTLAPLGERERPVAQRWEGEGANWCQAGRVEISWRWPDLARASVRFMYAPIRCCRIGEPAAHGQGFAMSLLNGWAPLSIIKAVLSSTVVAFFLGVLFEANVRSLFEEHGWDKILLRAVAKMPLLRDYRTFWFALGAVAGGAVIAWVAPHINIPATPSGTVVQADEGCFEWSVPDIRRNSARRAVGSGGAALSRPRKRCRLG